MNSTDATENRPELARGLPTFLVIGAMKSGTTSLWAYLSAHPHVFMTDPKEPQFFTWNWDLSLDWYQELFRDGAAAHARGEASTTYTLAYDTTEVAERIRRVVPEARLVYLVRHPIERIRSHYAYRVLYRNETRSIGVAVREDDRYVQPSRYAYHLERFLDRFPRDRVLLLTSDRLRDDRAATLQRLFRFVGVDPDFPVQAVETEHFRTSEIRKPRPWARRTLVLAQRTPLHYLPSSVSSRLYRATWRRFPHSMGVIPPDVERSLWDELAPQLERLRELTDAFVPAWEQPAG